MSQSRKVSVELWILTGIVALATAVSGYRPADVYTWLLEAGPVFIAAVVLGFTYQRFPLTMLSYRLITIHCLVLVLGAHYTYAEVPLGFWMQDWFGFERNHYDRIGHIAQGFIPAIVMREVLLRCSPLVRGKWLFVLTVCVCLAFSAFYELVEWFTALVSQEAADSFLGTQGDPWDTQWDMFLALSGAIIAQLVLGWLHDRQLRQLEPPV